MLLDYFCSFYFAIWHSAVIDSSWMSFDADHRVWPFPLFFKTQQSLVCYFEYPQVHKIFKRQCGSRFLNFSKEKSLKYSFHFKACEIHNVMIWWAIYWWTSTDCPRIGGTACVSRTYCLTLFSSGSWKWVPPRYPGLLSQKCFGILVTV